MTNARTRSKRSRRKEPFNWDTAPMLAYEVEIIRRQYSRTTIIIKAQSLHEAKHKADYLSEEDIDHWNPWYTDVLAGCVELAKGGQNND